MSEDARPNWEWEPPNWKWDWVADWLWGPLYAAGLASLMIVVLGTVREWFGGHPPSGEFTGSELTTTLICVFMWLRWTNKREATLTRYYIRLLHEQLSELAHSHSELVRSHTNLDDVLYQLGRRFGIKAETGADESP